MTVLKWSKEGASRCRVKINLVTTAGRKLIRSLDTSNDSQIEVSGQGDSSASTLSKENCRGGGESCEVGARVTCGNCCGAGWGLSANKVSVNIRTGGDLG